MCSFMGLHLYLTQAYRLEPLILKHYESVMPLRIHRFDSPNKVPYESMPHVAFGPIRPQPSASSNTLAEEKNGEDVEEGAREKGEKLTYERSSSRKCFLYLTIITGLVSTQCASLSAFVSLSEKGWTNVFQRSKKSKEEKLSAEMTVFDQVEKIETSENSNECTSDDEWVNYDVEVEIPLEETGD